MDPVKVQAVARLIEAIDAAAEQDTDTSVLLREFERQTGRSWGASHIVGYWKSMSAVELAMQALARPALSDDSLSLVRRLLAQEFPRHDIPDVVAELARRTGDHAFSDLIFWPQRDGMTPEEVLQVAEQRGRGAVLANTGFLDWIAINLTEVPSDMVFAVRQRLKVKEAAPWSDKDALSWLLEAVPPSKAGYLRQAYEKWRSSY